MKEAEKPEALGKPPRCPRFEPRTDPAVHHPDEQSDEQRGIAEEKGHYEDAGHQVRHELFVPPEDIMRAETKRLVEPETEIRGQARIPFFFHQRFKE